jgi:hypothetical protein
MNIINLIILSSLVFGNFSDNESRNNYTSYNNTNYVNNK